MVIFNSYVSLPEGIPNKKRKSGFIWIPKRKSPVPGLSRKHFSAASLVERMDQQKRPQMVKSTKQSTQSTKPGLVNIQKTMVKITMFSWENHGKMVIYMENHHV